MDFRNAGAGGVARRARDGWTLVEIVISMVFLLAALVGFAYGLASSTSLNAAVQEQGRAQAMARARLEELGALEFEEILVRHDGVPSNDPEDGPSPGPHFDVEGLSPSPEDPDGHVGELLFPLDEDGALREDLELARLGMPRDLDGDGELDGLDHSGDHRVLPVLVRLRWRGAAGDARLEMCTVLKRMRP